jgi:hypothetical protein
MPPIHSVEEAVAAPSRKAARVENTNLVFMASGLGKGKLSNSGLRCKKGIFGHTPKSDLIIFKM